MLREVAQWIGQLEYFPDCFCLGMTLQNLKVPRRRLRSWLSYRRLHTSWFFQALHNLPSTYYEDLLGVKGANGESAPRPFKLRRSVGAKTRQTSSRCRHQNLKLRRSDPPLPPAQAAPSPAAGGAAAAGPPRALRVPRRRSRRSHIVGAKTLQTSSQGATSSVAPCTGGPWAGGRRRRPPRRRPRQRRAKESAGAPVANNLVVLDEPCAVVCRNRTAIQLPAEFHLRPAFRGTGKGYDKDMQGIWQEHAIRKFRGRIGTRKDILGISLVIPFEVWYWFVYTRYIILEFDYDKDMPKRRTIWTMSSRMKGIWQAYDKKGGSSWTGTGFQMDRALTVSHTYKIAPYG